MKEFPCRVLQCYIYLDIEGLVLDFEFFQPVRVVDGGLLFALSARLTGRDAPALHPVKSLLPRVHLQQASRLVYAQLFYVFHITLQRVMYPFLQLRGLKIPCNSSHLITRRCEWTFKLCHNSS